VQLLSHGILGTAKISNSQGQYEKTTSTIAEYLRNTNLEELNPEGIQRPNYWMTPGAGALRDRLSGGSGNLSQTAQSAGRPE